MKTYTYDISNELLSCLCSNNVLEEIDEYNSVLIQVFSSQDVKKLRDDLEDIRKYIPHSKIITATTDGEIINKNIQLKSTVVSISLFGATNLTLLHVATEDSFKDGAQLAHKITNAKTKLLITFASGLSSNGEEFLNGINSVRPHLKVAGALSADNATFTSCYVGTGTDLYSSGVVGVALESDVLEVENIYHFGWKKIGQKHIVTRSKKNRIYTIDNLQACDFYTMYLGEDIANHLPATGIEFPLLIKQGERYVGRACVKKHYDGSLSFAGNINEGAVVYLGIGDIHNILSKKLISDNNGAIETFFIYSCMARRRFFPELIHKEIEPIAQLAPTIGFFGYGEFITQNKPEFFNETLSVIALSERKIPHLYFEKHDSNIHRSSSQTHCAMIHLLDTTAKELRDEFEVQANTFKMIQKIAHLGTWELDLVTGSITWSEESYAIYKRDKSLPPPTYLEFMMMVEEESRKELVAAQKVMSDGSIHSIEIKVQNEQGEMLNILESGKLIVQNGIRKKIVGTTLDITELRKKDSMLMHQAKLAQMGEMTSMIAHQWRQPLNAISAASIKLNMLSEMGTLTSKDVEMTTERIQLLTQNMSKTIDDFMNFAKPDDKKELIDFPELINEINNLIGVQLKNYNIELKVKIKDCVNQLYSYKKELEHVLLNLISNARDACINAQREQKFISLNIYMLDNYCFIEVEDNAGGIPQKIKNQIFHPYFTTKKESHGTGLGLYMSRKIVHEHLGGKISVVNTKTGAKFTIILRHNDEG